MVNTKSKEPKEALRQLKSLKCPGGVNIKKIKVLPDRFEVRCDTVESKCKLKNFLEEHLQEEASVEDKRPALQKIMLLNAPDDVDENEILAALPLTTVEKENARAIATFNSRYDGKSHWIFLVPKRSVNKITSQGFVQLGFRRVRVKRYVYIHRCKNCQLINDHHTSQCTYKAYCAKCGGKHSSENCESSKPSCINCKGHNSAQKDKAKASKDYKPVICDTAHSADAPGCKVYKDVLQGNYDQ